MRGWHLYAVTLLIEMLSVACRFLLVVLLAGPFWERDTAFLLAGIAAAAPVLYSLLVVGGLPSGHIFMRWALKARLPTRREATIINAALEQIEVDAVERPRHIFLLDAPGPNAAVSGTTLFVQRELLTKYRAYLPAILAHELGHLRHGDGQVLLGLRALVVPGAFVLANTLLLLLHFVGVAVLVGLNILIGLLRLGFLVRLLQVLFDIFLVYIPRYLVIFAMGGVGPKLLDRAWEHYFIEREYLADSFAARRGQRDNLIRFFLRYSLDDVTIPWSQRRTHPKTRDRINRLIEEANASLDSWLDLTDAGLHDHSSQTPPADTVLRLPQWTAWVVYGLAVLVTAWGLWSIVLPLGRQALHTPPARIPVATAGPTPTLGISPGSLMPPVE